MGACALLHGATRSNTNHSFMLYVIIAQLIINYLCFICMCPSSMKLYSIKSFYKNIIIQKLLMITSVCKHT